MNELFDKLFDIRIAQLSTCAMLFNAFLLLLTRGLVSMFDLPVEVSNLFVIPLTVIYMGSLGITVFLLIGNMFKSSISKLDI